MVLALVVFGAGSAWAALTHPFVASFGSFSGVEGIAVDHASGDVYVYDAGAGSILKFDGTGNPVNFSALGTNEIDGKGGFDCPTTPSDCDRVPTNGFLPETGIEL